MGLGECVETLVEDLPQAAQYRTAVARGLVNKPAVLMIENLDGGIAGAELEEYTELLRKAGAQFGTAIIATATAGLRVKPADRVLDLTRGAITRDSVIVEAGQ